MRVTFQTLLLSVVLLAIPCAAVYDNMPTPPPTPMATRDANQPEKGRVKRGIRWYRHPQCDTAAAQWSVAEQYEHDDHLRKAANACQELVYAWPDSPEAGKAQWALARVQAKRGKYEKAFDEYQYLFDYMPGQFDYATALENQFKIANYLMSTPKAAFLFFHGFQAPERAIPMFEAILRNAPTWSRAAEAQLNIGICHELNDEDEEAVAAYEAFRNRYTDPVLSGQASFRQARCLYRIYQYRPNNENACDAARAALSEFIQSYPLHENCSEAKGLLLTLNREQVKRAFTQAAYYDRIAHRPKAAIIAYEEFLKQYGGTEWAPRARERLDSLKKEIAGHEKK